ncbi:MAG: hypothetical protein HC884_10915 [Chloroflexaceae bacterium]|nr:hypothetical protein [Chloroflexaceae bacterium]
MQHKPIFLSDAPVSYDENILWEMNGAVMHQISEIVKTILSEPGKLTFAIHGAWGSGKTSFLKMIEHQVEERVKSQPQPQQNIVFCWYNASTFQNTATADTTLALQMFSKLSSPGEQGDPLSIYKNCIQDMLGSLNIETCAHHSGSPLAHDVLENSLSASFVWQISLTG